jgi:hypothetical protein
MGDGARIEEELAAQKAPPARPKYPRCTRTVVACTVKKMFIDLIFQRLYVLTGAAEIGVTIKTVYTTMKTSVFDLPTIDTFAFRKYQQSISYGRSGDQTIHLQSPIDRFPSRK